MYSVATLFILIHVESYALQLQNGTVNSYHGAQVWRTNLRGSSDILLIKKLMNNQDISVWSLTPKRADFLVKSEDKLRINRLLSSQNLNHSVVVMDVQRRVDAQRSVSVLWDDKALRVGHRLKWNEYPTLKIIEEYFNYLTENFPSICELRTIGKTTENRTIKMLKISNGNPDNKAILIASGMHSREWISITSALYILDIIVSKFDHLPRYMKNKEWLVIPLLNPDGFEYSQTHDRLWRKNRRQCQYSDCKGVDVNRNFELNALWAGDALVPTDVPFVWFFMTTQITLFCYQPMLQLSRVDWNINGITEEDECSESYSGPHPFSEAESKALRDVVLNSKKKPDAFIDLHSYGQLILYPWCARPALSNNRNTHSMVAGKMSSAIFNSTGQRYKAGVAYHTIYPATGAAIDWIYASGVPQSFAIESGDDGLYGFLLPPDQIERTGKETLAAVKELARHIGPDYLNRSKYGPWF